MLGSSNLIAFLATNDAEQAKTFYEHTLGLRLVADEPFALVFDANGVMLRIQKMDHAPAVQHTVLGWQVTDIRATVAALRDRGVAFERYPNMTQDDDGVWTSPAGAQVAWFRDPSGNLLSLTQF